MGNIVSVFWYEPFGIFSVFTIPIPKENSVSIFGILKLVGAPFSQRQGGGLRPPCVHFALLLRDKRNSRQIFKKRVPAKSSKGVPAKSYIKNTQLWDFGKIVIPIRNTDRTVPVIYQYRQGGVKKWDTTAQVTIENFWARRGRELSQILTEELFILGIWECS